ncbi:tetraacyldisaccharide 4'-kinase [Agaribacterium sp. ZY112]|uniref:tetraacyldisaccharide 4'-kinase n=1 Tax=Agaribacterium sp. ZY112 TaxID=3233574 RepID=UPI0035235CA9
MSLAAFFEKHWYAESPGPLSCLYPLELLFKQLSSKRREKLLAQHHKLNEQSNKRLPLVVVGNISVGGTGKTPFIIALVRRLQQQNYKVAVVSRGYGRDTEDCLKVEAESKAEEVGDEPLEVFLATACELWVAAERNKAVAAVIAHGDADVILSDDGLQHYAMARDIEIAIVGSQGLGNGHLLPVGPLREPASRLDSVDFVFNRSAKALHTTTPSYAYQSHLASWVHVHTAERRSLAEGIDSDDGREHNYIAYAGIAQPERFFSELTALGLQFEARPKADHYRYKACEFTAGSTYIVTAKDAVKCREFSEADIWYLELQVELSDAFYNAFTDKLSALNHEI